MQAVKRIKYLGSAIEKSTKVSLFEYLGTPAGKELGHKVWETAKRLGIPVEKRKVSNPKYTGNVNIYPEMFLDIYFFMSEEYVLESVECEAAEYRIEL